MQYNQHPVVIDLTITFVHAESHRRLGARHLTRKFAPGELPMLEAPVIGDKFKLFINSVRIIDREIRTEEYYFDAVLEFEVPDDLQTQDQIDAYTLSMVQRYIAFDFREFA